MTEQFMENISNEEHERLLLLCGHGIGPSLSPAAQAVLDAANDAFDRAGTTRQGLAAALRAATADKNKQIDVPFSKVDQWEKIKGSTLSYWTAAQWGYTKAMDDLLAIAAELEALQ